MIEDKVKELMGIKDSDLFIEKLGDLSAVLVERNYPWLPDVISKIKKLEDGEVHITLRVKAQRVTTAVFHEFTKAIYK